MLELKPFCIDLSRINNKFTFSETTWERMEAFHEPLKIVSEKMTNFQKADLTLSDLYAEWIDLKERLEMAPQTNFVVKLLESICEREKPILNNIMMLAAVCLDPRLQILLTPPERAVAISLITELHGKINLSPCELPPESSPEPSRSDALSSTVSSQNGKYGALENYLRSIEASRNESNSPATLRLNSEISNFQKLKRISIDESIHDFWRISRKNFPLLYDISCIFMSISPTEVSVERNFSKLGFILNRLRTRLTDNEVEKFLLLTSKHTVV